jgi:cytochrome P450
MELYTSLEVLTMTDGRVFARPDEFLPERWTTEPDLVIDPSAFIPFNSGMACHPEHPILADVYPTYR